METRPYILPHCLRNKLFRFGLAAVVLFAGNATFCEQIIGQVGSGVAAFFGNSVTLEHFAKRSENDFHVAKEGDFLDVFKIVADFGFPGDGVAPVYLRKPAESLPHGVPPALFGGHEHHVAHELGPGPDYGHVALEDVEEFGQLVEAGGAEELAVGVQPHVVGEQVAIGVLFVGHGAELDELENLFVKARARLREEGVAMHLDCAEDREHEQQRAQGENRGQRAAEIKDSF